MTALPMLLAAASCVPAADALGARNAAPVAAAATQAVPPVEPPPPEAAMQASLWTGPAPVFTAPSRQPAQPFDDSDASGLDRERSLDCLAAAVYYESRGEPEDGQRAVAQVVLNRVRHPSFPSSVCGVVYQGSERRTGCQFTFTCDGSLMRRPFGEAWDRARRIAAEALAGSVFAPVGNATHYHAASILPYWASSLTRAAVIGSQIFYRWNGSQGLGSAFRQRYAGAEPGTGGWGGDFGSGTAVHIAVADAGAHGGPRSEFVRGVAIYRGGATVADAAPVTPAAAAAATPVAIRHIGSRSIAGVRVHSGTVPADIES